MQRNDFDRSASGEKLATVKVCQSSRTVTFHKEIIRAGQCPAKFIRTIQNFATRDSFPFSLDLLVFCMQS